MDRLFSSLSRLRWRLVALVGFALLAGCDPVAAEATAAAWWQVWAPVAVVVLASVVTALTRYPRAAGLVTLLQVLLDLLSALSHRDSPGKAKWPGTRSAPPSEVQDAPPGSPGAAGSALVLLVGLGLALALPACAPAYATVEATARAGSVAITEFKTYDAAHKRELLAAHPECRAASAPAGCYKAVLAPYVAQREPVLASIDALAPALQAAKATAAQADTDRAVTAALAAQLGNLVAQLLNAVATLEGSAR